MAIVKESTLSRDEMRTAGQLAIGRLLRLMSRPYQSGDEAQYAAARAVCMEAAEAIGIDTAPGYRPNYARDRRSGAAGD